MAKLIEEVVVLKLSKIVKDSAAATEILMESTIAELEQVTQELVGDSIVVEIERA